MINSHIHHRYDCLSLPVSCACAIDFYKNRDNRKRVIQNLNGLCANYFQQLKEIAPVSIDEVGIEAIPELARGNLALSLVATLDKGVAANFLDILCGEIRSNAGWAKDLELTGSGDDKKLHFSAIGSVDVTISVAWVGMDNVQKQVTAFLRKQVDCFKTTLGPIVTGLFIYLAAAMNAGWNAAIFLDASFIAIDFCHPPVSVRLLLQYSRISSPRRAWLHNCQTMHSSSSRTLFSSGISVMSTIFARRTS